MRSPEFLRLVDQIHDVITSTELPDVARRPRREATTDRGQIEPLPRARSGDVVALVESPGGDGAAAATYSRSPATHRRRSIGWCAWSRPPRCWTSSTRRGDSWCSRRSDTGLPRPQRRAETDLAREDLSPNCSAWRATSLTLRGGVLSREELIRSLPTSCPPRIPRSTFDTLVAWARFGDLFKYSETTQQLTRAGSEAPA